LYLDNNRTVSGHRDAFQVYISLAFCSLQCPEHLTKVLKITSANRQYIKLSPGGKQLLCFRLDGGGIERLKVDPATKGKQQYLHT
jgi:hypothetical protein